jgi:DNA-binding NarL/FixJ family response regulator
VIIEDIRDVREGLSVLINGTPGFCCTGAYRTMEAALTGIRASGTSVILTDIGLPGMSGVELVRELAPRLPHTRIVMLTMSAADRDVADAMRYGASGYLTKDLSPDALARSLRATQSGELVMPRRLAARLLAKVLRRGLPAAPEGTDASMDRLTSRERDILRLLADGLGDRDIAAALTISRRTVESHVSSILRKLDVPNRAEAARRYRGES